MRVNITANTCTIDNNVYLNAGEYNINKFYFTFSEEYLDEYVKKALFIDKDGTPIEMVIANNECDIPYDILKNPGTYTFGVYAYEMNGTELALRYSPEPTHFYVNKGSYMENGTSPTEPTPDEFAQYYQAMQDLIANAKPELIDYIEDNLPTIHVGETSTLTPGTPATVTNVGTERNPIFDFGIPQGVPGTTDYNELVNKPDLTVFALVTESANKIALEIDSTEFKIKAKILDKNNRLISESNVIDLPLESVVVGGEYDATNKKIILTLENGNVIEIPVEDLIDGLATKTELEEGLATKDANIIESISKNGAPLPVNANKNVNITVPTRTSEVLNDSGFITNDTNGLSHYYNKTASDTRFSLVTETGSNFTLSIDPATFVMTATLKDKNGRALSVQTVDLPLESVVVGGSYDSETREVVLTLENGSVVRFSVADLVSGLQSEITDSNKLSSDLVDDTNSVNKFITAEEKTQIATNENDISDIKDEQEIQNEHLDELDMIYNAFPTVSSENDIIQLDDTAKVKFKEIDLKGNTSQVVISEEQGTSVSNTSIYVSDVNTDKEHTIGLDGNTYQETTTGKNLAIFEQPSTTINGLTITYDNATGKISVNGKANATAGARISLQSNTNIPSGTYTLSINRALPTLINYTITDSQNNNVAFRITTGNTSVTNTLSNNGVRASLFMAIENNVTYNLEFYMQLESGSTATSFEKFTYGASPNPNYPQNIEVVTGTNNVTIANGDNTQSTTYPVNLGNIELCKISTYKDRIYKSNDKWYLEKNIDKKILNGTYNDITINTSSTNTTRVSFNSILEKYAVSIANASQLCNRLISKNVWSSDEEGFFASATSYNIVIRINKSTIGTTEQEVNTYLSQNNLLMYFPVQESTTTEITDTTLVSQLNALYNSTLYSTTNINTDTSNLLPYIDLQYNVVTPAPSPQRASNVNVVSGNNTITISNSDNTEIQNYHINLGDMELCKIGTYQDYIYESNGNWFKKSNIGKVVLNGSENWQTELYTYYLTNFNAKPYSTFSPTTPYAYANYFKWGNGSSGSFVEGSFWYTLDGSKLRVEKDNPLDLNTFKTWLSTHNAIVYYPLATPTDTQITDTTLITQLNNIKKAYSYDSQTNISQTNTDKPFIIYAEAIDNNADLLTDYVKNTDYATASKGGVVKDGQTSLGYGISQSGINAGKINANILTYQQYQNNLYTNGFIGKGTLENVITGKDLTTKAYVDGLVGDISNVIDAINGEVV